MSNNYKPIQKHALYHHENVKHPLILKYFPAHLNFIVLQWRNPLLQEIQWLW